MYFQRLRDLREDRDLRQQDIAELLHTSQTVYSRYERGFQTIPVSTFTKHLRITYSDAPTFEHLTRKSKGTKPQCAVSCLFSYSSGFFQIGS